VVHGSGVVAARPLARHGAAVVCSFELHTVVVDTGESPLEDDDVEE
jgi:hypothetical protein